MKLLLIEDDNRLAAHLSECLREHGFLVTSAQNRNELEEILESNPKFELIIMDRLLGSVDSKQYMPKIRKLWPSLPVIVLSAISTPNERTDLINLGADDYIGKPFSTQELIARVRAQLRRNSTPQGNYLQVGNLIIDSMAHTVSVGEKATSLPAREFSLLRTLAVDPTRIWSKDELLDYVWGQATTVETNVVESTIANIRKRIGGLGANVSIRNLRNAGYWIAQ